MHANPVAGRQREDTGIADFQLVKLLASGGFAQAARHDPRHLTPAASASSPRALLTWLMSLWRGGEESVEVAYERGLVHRSGVTREEGGLKRLS